MATSLTALIMMLLFSGCLFEGICALLKSINTLFTKFCKPSFCTTFFCLGSAQALPRRGALPRFASALRFFCKAKNGLLRFFLPGFGPRRSLGPNPGKRRASLSLFAPEPKSRALFMVKKQINLSMALQLLLVES